MAAKRLQVASTSVRDIERALAKVGAEIIERETTQGAVGYTTITVARVLHHCP